MQWTGHREVVVVTGASAGVGRATARAFARQGARLGLIARGRDGLDGAVRDAQELGGEAIGIVADASDDRAMEEAASQVEQAFGPIDTWVNNAMVSVFSPVKEMEAEDYRRVTDVTYLGVVWGTLAALRRMLPRNRGVIVQVGSALAYRGIPLQSAYCAAKHAIEGFTESLRTELLHDRSRVQVTMVHLPAINTPQFNWVKSRLPNRPQPVPPIYQPEVAAEAILYAAHNPKREYKLGFPTLKAVYGNRIAPDYADRYLARHGYSSQQTDEADDPNRPHNLWEPLRGDWGAHGEFDERATDWSPQWWANTHRRTIGVAVGGLLLLGAAAAILGRSDTDRPRRPLPTARRSPALQARLW